MTDEFIAHIKALGADWELEQTTQFLVVASTLLDLKIVRLLPSADVEDEEDLALLEARDLLFARLMQYRAFKQVAAVFEQRLAEESPAGPAIGRPRRAVRQGAARRARSRSARTSSPRSPREALAPKPEAVARPRPPARAAGQRARAGGDARRAAAPNRPRRRSARWCTTRPTR